MHRRTAVMGIAALSMISAELAVLLLHPLDGYNLQVQLLHVQEGSHWYDQGQASH